jgi:hypothetical protein
MDEIAHELSRIIDKFGPRAVDAGAERSQYQLRDGQHRRRGEYARSDRVYPDTGSGQIARHRKSHSDDGSLAGRIGGLADLAFERCATRRVDDRTPIAVRAGLVAEHRARGQPDHVERPDHVQRHRAGEAIERVGRGVFAVPPDRAVGRAATRAVHHRPQRRDG